MRSPTSITIPSQSAPGNNRNVGLLYIPRASELGPRQFSIIPWASFSCFFGGRGPTLLERI